MSKKVMFRSRSMTDRLRRNLRNNYVLSSVEFVKQRSGSIPVIERCDNSKSEIDNTLFRPGERIGRLKDELTTEYQPKNVSVAGATIGDEFITDTRRQSMRTTISMMNRGPNQLRGSTKPKTKCKKEGQVKSFSSGKTQRHRFKQRQLPEIIPSIANSEDLDNKSEIQIGSQGKSNSNLNIHTQPTRGIIESRYDDARSRRKPQPTREKGKMGAKFRRLAKFLTILFGLWRTHSKKVQKYLENNVDFLDVELPDDLMFDVTEFKADTQTRVASDVKAILLKSPNSRTTEEVRHIQVALGNYEPIAEYPLRMTSLIAQKAWYERYTPKRVIVKQGHPARCYYFILSGTAVVTKSEGTSDLSRTECFLGRGESFGDLGLVTNAPRQASVISREDIELLVIGDEEYVEIFMSGGIKDPEDPFLKTLYYMNGLPNNLLANNPEQGFLSYFKRGTVLVYNSLYNDWIYIIKSGSCNVLKKLKDTQLTPLETSKQTQVVAPAGADHIQILHQKQMEVDRRWDRHSFIYRQKRLQELDLGVPLIPIGSSNWNYLSEMTKANTAHKLRLSITGPFMTKTNMVTQPPSGGSNPVTEKKTRRLPSKHPVIPEIQVDDKPVILKDESRDPEKPQIHKPQPKGAMNKRTLTDELNESYLTRQHVMTRADHHPVFILVNTLTKGSVFVDVALQLEFLSSHRHLFLVVGWVGVSVVEALSDLVHNDQPSLSLVSNGAECIVIKKKLYWEHVNKRLHRILKQEVVPYPTDDELQRLLQQQVDWSCGRDKLVQVILRERKMENTNIHDARSIPDLRD